MGRLGDVDVIGPVRQRDGVEAVGIRGRGGDLAALLSGDDLRPRGGPMSLRTHDAELLYCATGQKSRSLTPHLTFTDLTSNMAGKPRTRYVSKRLSFAVRESALWIGAPGGAGGR